MRGEGISGRRALSPLIATILLIAFAVALGTLIMTWTVPGPEHEENGCEAISLTLQQLPSGDAICYDPQKQSLSFVVENRGKQLIPVMSLFAIDKQQNIKEQDVPADLEPGRAGKFELRFDTLSPTGITAKITPAIVEDGKRNLCPDKIIEKISVPLC